jgi:hypothetical protein
VTQPWQGEGVLLDNGHGKLDPFVMTAGRRQRHSLFSVPTSGIVDMPGFDTLSIAWANAQEPQSGKTHEAVEARQHANA